MTKRRDTLNHAECVTASTRQSKFLHTFILQDKFCILMVVKLLMLDNSKVVLSSASIARGRAPKSNAH
jgi:hypothetical protein